MAGEGAAQGRHHRGTGTDGRAGLVADDEVEVALTDPGLLVELVVQVRQGQDRLGRHRPVVDHDRQLAAARGDHAAVHEDVVAEVDELLPAGQGLVADLGQRDHGLDAGAVAGLQGREAELAGVAGEHDAAGDADDVLGLLAGLEVGVLLADSRDRRGDRELGGVGVDPGVEELRPLVEPDLSLLAGLLGGQGFCGGLFAHCWCGSDGSWGTLRWYRRFALGRAAGGGPRAGGARRVGALARVRGPGAPRPRSCRGTGRRPVVPGR